MVGGLLGKWLGIPAGVLLFSMLFTLALKLKFNNIRIPRWLRRMAQVLSGSCIGVQVAGKDLLELKYLIVPTFILIIGYTLNCFFTSMILNRRYNIDKMEAMFCVSPAGATEMALIAADLWPQVRRPGGNADYQADTGSIALSADLCAPSQVYLSMTDCVMPA
jgi:membrane AbrB-like protein